MKHIVITKPLQMQLSTHAGIIGHSKCISNIALFRREAIGKEIVREQYRDRDREKGR